MRLPFPSRGRKPPAPTAKLKSFSSRTSDALPDLVSTSLLALKESAAAFPPLESAVGGVLALWDIAERAKHCKSDAHDIALRTGDILDMIAGAVPDASAIPLPMLQSIERFTVVLDEIRCSMEVLTRSTRVSRIVHLKRNERSQQRIKAQLDEAYRDFQTASVLRVESRQGEHAEKLAQIDDRQMQFSIQHAYHHQEVSIKIDALALNLSTVSFYSRLAVLFGRGVAQLN